MLHFKGHNIHQEKITGFSKLLIGKKMTSYYLDNGVGNSGPPWPQLSHEHPLVSRSTRWHNAWYVRCYTAFSPGIHRPFFSGEIFGPILILISSWPFLYERQTVLFSAKELKLNKNCHYQFKLKNINENDLMEKSGWCPWSSLLPTPLLIAGILPRLISFSGLKSLEFVIPCWLFS